VPRRGPGDRLADAAASDVDLDEFRAERLGERRAKPLGEVPAGVLLRLLERDEPELPVAAPDIPSLETGGSLAQLGAHTIELLDPPERRGGDRDPPHGCLLLFAAGSSESLSRAIVFVS